MINTTGNINHDANENLLTLKTQNNKDRNRFHQKSANGTTDSSKVLVDIQWVKEHLHDPKVRIAEVNYNIDSNYVIGHIPGSVLFDWKTMINDPITRNIISKKTYEDLLQENGVNNDTTLVLYGDFSNWFAAYAFWVFKHYGFDDLRLMNGGRKKWIQEAMPIDKNIPTYPKGNFTASKPCDNTRVFMPYIRDNLNSRDKILIDVRSPEEYTGEVLAPPEYPTEHALRGGHIPGAVNFPWSKVVNQDGTFKRLEELRDLFGSMKISSDKEVITYCRIGERSSMIWFVLKYLLGYPDVKNYDGSWMEWGNTVGNSIER